MTDYYKSMTDAEFAAELRSIGIPPSGWADDVWAEVERRDWIAAKLGAATLGVRKVDAAYGRQADPDADPLALDAPDWYRPPLGDAVRILRAAYFERLEEIARGEPMISYQSGPVDPERDTTIHKAVTR